MNLNKAQATPITVVILTAATLAIALSIYAYFQSQASVAEQERLLELEVSATASMIDVNVVSWESDNTTSPTIACYYIDLINIGDQYKTFWFTLLPLERQATGVYLPTLDINIVPVDQDTPLSGVNLYFYNFTDGDGDGELEILGNGGLVLYNALPECSDIRGNSTTLSNALQTLSVNASRIFLTTDKFSLVDSVATIGVTINKPLPLLELRLRPKQTESLLVYVQFDDWDVPGDLAALPTGLYLTVFTEYNGEMYLAIAFEMPTS
ncbi:MAG: hypothetical protein F7C81_04625 [Desulfurococcales archaeon]|nr:hypothetical protein [Desulfurococcales archaeon]